MNMEIILLSMKKSSTYNELMKTDKAQMIEQADALILQIKTEQGL